MQVASPLDSRNARLPEVELAGLRIHAVTEPECVEHIVSELDAGNGGWVVTPNLDHLRRFQSEPAFRDACERATLRVADGRPLLWASALQSTPLPGLVAGSNLINSLSERAASTPHTVFLLGGDPGTAEEAARVLTERYPGLRIAGTHCPEFGFEKDAATMDALRSQLVDSGADIVFVALGSPKQEFVIEQLRASLPTAWWLGVGISFSFVTGAVKRAPRWMQRVGLEWAHRLIQEPRRLARRYLVDGLPFAVRLFAHSLWVGIRGRG